MVEEEVIVVEVVPLRKIPTDATRKAREDAATAVIEDAADRQKGKKTENVPETETKKRKRSTQKQK